MKSLTNEKLIQLIREDIWMMSVLQEAEKLNLPDWMIGAGFLRTKVWDYLHGIKREIALTHDIDLIYFDSNNLDEEYDKQLSLNMKGKFGLEWEIVNQAYTHVHYDRKDVYKNTEEALSEWVETSTCVAVTLKDDMLQIIAPHGTSDLFSLIVRPSPAYVDKIDVFNDRVHGKKWLEKWDKLKVVID